MERGKAINEASKLSDRREKRKGRGMERERERASESQRLLNV